jgi:hypothetical protein
VGFQPTPHELFEKSSTKTLTKIAQVRDFKTYTQHGFAKLKFLARTSGEAGAAGAAGRAASERSEREGFFQKAGGVWGETPKKYFK